MTSTPAQQPAPLDQPPTTSVQVMRAGTALSPDVAQFLASEVATAASRERDRRITIGVVGGVVSLGVLGLVLFVGEFLPALFAASAVFATALLVGLAWGVRNRALLDRSAHDAAMPPSVLVAAVQQVRRGAGPSTALRDAIEADARVRSITARR